MIIIKEDKVINSDHVCYFEKEINPYNKFLIVFYFPVSDGNYQTHAWFWYELEEDRDRDYLKIIKAYKLNEKIVEL